MSNASNLPQGWTWAEISEISLPGETWNPRTAGVDQFKYVDIEAVDNKRQRIVSPRTLPTGQAPSRARVAIKKGDVLFSLVRPYLKNIVVVPEELDRQVASTAFLAVRPASGVSSSFIFNYFLQDSFINSVPTYGNSPPAARDDEFVRLRVPLAPSAEQKRISGKVDELLSDLDAGVAALERARANLKRYRAAVLKAAVEGRLTEQWRKEHPDVEPASKLLERILGERRKKWEEAQLAKYAAAGKTPPKGWKDKYPEPAKPDTAALPDLPTGWCWTHIEQLCEFGPHALKAGPFGSSIKKSMYVSSGYKIYGQEQVIRGDPYYGDYYIDQKKFEELKSCATKPGDLLISLVGTIGRTLVLPEDAEPGIINPRLIKVSLNRELVVPAFLQSYLKSPQVRAVFKLVSHGGTMEILNMGTLTSLAYPLPPKEEQQAIVNEIAAADSIVDHVSMSLEGQLNTASRLRQSILRRAFEGRLVSQDPNDEPASVLLERICAARAANASASHARKGRQPSLSQS